MTTLTKEDALTLHAEGNEKTKQWILNKFGKELLANDWMTIWEDWKKKNKQNINLPFPGTKDREEQRTNAYHMLIHIVPIERGDFEPDYDDNNYKYEPIFHMSSSGFGFSLTTYDYWLTRTYFGSRLCSGTREKCKQIATNFLPIYEKLQTK